MNLRTLGVRFFSAVMFVLALVPVLALADASITSVVATPANLEAGDELDVEVNVTLAGGTSADWQSTYIALDNGTDTIELYCGNAPNISNTDGAASIDFLDLLIPILAAPDTYDVLVRVYDNDFECDDNSADDNDDDVTSPAETVTIDPTTVTLPASVELDLVLCLDGSGSIDSSDWTLQLDGTTAGLTAALDPDHLDSSVRVTAIVFSDDAVVGPGPTVINSSGTLTTFNTAVEALNQPENSTNTADCISAALFVMCGNADCPDDGVKRVIDVSTDGNPTSANCGGNAPNLDGFDEDEECAIFRAEQADTAGVDVLNAIGVGSGIGQDNLEAWVFPPGGEVFDTDQNEFPEPGDEGFVILVGDFEDYEPAITAKLEAELAQATFTVNKTYDDDNTTAVLITLTCDEGVLIDDNTKNASPDTPAVFNLTDYEDGDECTAVESGVPAGYTADNDDCDEVDIDTDGECTIANTANKGEFTVRKLWTDKNEADVQVTATCTSPAVVTSDNPDEAGDSGSAIFDIERVVQGTTCTATEAVPADYQADQSDCVDVPIPIDGGGSCVITNSPLVGVNRATFTVNKVFSDGNNVTPVKINIQCFTGLPLNQSQVVETDNNGQFEVEFVVESFDQGDLDCDVWEDPIPGYSGSYEAKTFVIGIASDDDEGCHFDDVDTSEAGDTHPQHTCDIINDPDPVTVTIDKHWVIEGSGGDAVSSGYKLRLYCTHEILGGYYKYGKWSKKFWNQSGLDDATYSAEVIPYWNGGTSCHVDETVFDDAVEVDNGCDDLRLAINEGDSCTITNTVFFEGIPTLSQYGMVILALLMLGAGLVGFRRFV